MSNFVSSIMYHMLSKIKIEIVCRLYCIDIYDDDCKTSGLETVQPLGDSGFVHVMSDYKKVFESPVGSSDSETLPQVHKIRLQRSTFLIHKFTVVILSSSFLKMVST